MHISLRQGTNCQRADRSTHSSGNIAPSLGRFKLIRLCFPIYITLTLRPKLTRAPLPWKDLARNAICKRHCGKANPDHDLSADDPVNISGSRCNCSTNERDKWHADHEGLSELEEVCHWGENGTKNCLHKIYWIGNPYLGGGIIEVIPDESPVSTSK